MLHCETRIQSRRAELRRIVALVEEIMESRIASPPANKSDRDMLDVLIKQSIYLAAILVHRSSREQRRPLPRWHFCERQFLGAGTRDLCSALPWTGGIRTVPPRSSTTFEPACGMRPEPSFAMR